MNTDPDWPGELLLDHKKAGAGAAAAATRTANLDVCNKTGGKQTLTYIMTYKKGRKGAVTLLPHLAK